MTLKYEQDILQKLKRRKLKRSWSRLVTALMCVVVFCTTYALILPAITQETDTFCGMEAHTHTEDCYPKQSDLICEFADTEIHIHTEDCTPTLGTAANCGLEEIAAHSHDESCTLAEAQMICTLAETEGHTHSEACAPTTVQTLICALAETEGHAHSEACAPTTVQDLICSLEENEEHAHTDTCYTVSTVYGCGLEEAEAHAHTEACYSVSTVYGCGLEEAEAHSHTEACYNEVYSCGLEETEGHTHSEACFPTVYSCGLDGVEHTHIESCYNTSPVLVCELAEDETHTHSAECYDSTLLCGLEEHEHEPECYSDPSADVEDASVWEATLPASLGGTHAENLLAVAQSQIGYGESTRNYIVDTSGEIKGYSRYGAWCGLPYEDWSAMFVSFCLHYAHVDVIPKGTLCTAWVHNLKSAGRYQSAADYLPGPGDIIFFDRNGDGSPDHVGIVSSYDPAEDHDSSRIQTIEGDSANVVRYNTYNLSNSTIFGYGILFEPQFSTEEEPATEDPVVEDPAVEDPVVEDPVVEDPVEETPPLPEATIDPQSTTAWAVIVEDGSQAADTTEKAATFSLRSPASTFQMTRAGTPKDLTPYIIGVVMYDANSKPIENGATVTEGDMIEYKIEYTVTGHQLGIMNGEDLTIYTDTLVYKIPDTLNTIDNESGNIVNSSKQPVGTYVIENNIITMTFWDEFVRENATEKPIHGFISLFTTAIKITDNEGESSEHKFTDDITLGVIIEKKEEVVGDLKIQKNKLSVDGEEITYEILVTSTEGTTGPITITDQMSEGLTFKEGLEVLDSSGTPVSDAQFNPAEDNRSFTMTLPEMQPGGSYVIRYKCKADIDLLGADMTVSNTASVDGKDSHENELHADSTIEHTFDMLEKTGELNGDGSITWTITINRAKADLSGWTLEDKITSAQGDKPFTGPVTIKDSSGNVVAENTALPYTFPEGSNDTYVITYTTTHGYGDGEMIYNKVSLKDTDTDITVVKGVGIGSPFQKSGTHGTLTQDPNGNSILPITWTVTIDTAKGSIPAGEVLCDKMQGADQAAEVYMTYSQLMAAYTAIENALAGAGSSASTISAVEYVKGTSVGGSHDKNALTTDDACKSLLYEGFSVTLGSEIPQGQTITFTYETYGTFPDGLPKDSVFTNQFSLEDKYVIEGKVDYVSGTVLAEKHAMKPYNPKVPNANQDWSLDWQSPSKFNYSELHEAYLAWAIDVKVSPGYSSEYDVILFEDLPEGVTVKGLDWSFSNNVPTGPAGRLTLKDMVPGTTYQWKFTLYPLEDYVNYTFTTGQETTISVTYTESKDLRIVIPDEMLRRMGQYAAATNTTPSADSRLFVYTQIDEDFAWTPTGEDTFVYVNSFENKYTMQDENGKMINMGSQTQIIRKDESEDTIRKKATVDTTDNTVNYSVVLNAYGKDLVKNSETLAIHDVLTYTSTPEQSLRLRLQLETLKLYEVDMNLDGSYTKLHEIPTKFIYDELSSVNNSVTTWTHTIDLTVPDGKALVLEYTYSAGGATNVNHSVFNTCTITGVGEGGMNDDFNIKLEVRQSAFQADLSGASIRKLDADDNGTPLENAIFNVYVWHAEANDGAGGYIIVHHPDNGDKEFKTSADGTIALNPSTIKDQFAYNTAYYIVETVSPEGYYLDPTPYYFYLPHSNTTANPIRLPDNFEGHALTDGDVIFRRNVSALTEISVEKYWLDYGGNPMTVNGDKVNSVKIELWQRIDGDPDSDTRYDTYTMTPDADGNWKLTITDLPKATRNPDGTKGTPYLYYVKEVAVNGFALDTANNNTGINSGVIKLVNKEQEGYVLPETGGSGTALYTTAGSLLMLTGAAYLVYSKYIRRREDQ